MNILPSPESLQFRDLTPGEQKEIALRARFTILLKASLVILAVLFVQRYALLLGWPFIVATIAVGATLVWALRERFPEFKNDYAIKCVAFITDVATLGIGRKGTYHFDATVHFRGPNGLIELRNSVTNRFLEKNVRGGFCIVYVTKVAPHKIIHWGEVSRGTGIL
jgi:hypothetical protein